MIENCENACTILDYNGWLIGEYVKIHPFSYSGEDKNFLGGDNVSVYSVSGIPMLTFICYDLRFLEIFRSVTDRIHCCIVAAG